MNIALTSVLVCAAGLAAEVLWLGASGRRPRPGEAVPEHRELRRYRLWGIFYCNPDDPRGWVPKMSGLGWTVNVRRKSWAWLMVLLFLGTVLPSLLLGTRHP